MHENPTISITDTYTDDFGDAFVKYTIIVPGKNGHELIHGRTKLEEEIIIPIHEND